jgi:hypothetical protein
MTVGKNIHVGIRGMISEEIAGELVRWGRRLGRETSGEWTGGGVWGEYRY